MNTFEDIDNFVPPKRKNVVRNAQAYDETEALITREIENALEEIRGIFEDNQTHRLLRDEIEFWIRRYQDYSIQGNFTAHYFEIGVPLKECMFEHVIPLKELRELLLGEKITIRQALNSPTCMLHKDNDRKLTESGLVKSTPSRRFFFKRYTSLGIQIKTYNGYQVNNLDTWSLLDHFNFFKII